MRQNICNESISELLAAFNPSHQGGNYSIALHDRHAIILPTTHDIISAVERKTTQEAVNAIIGRKADNYCSPSDFLRQIGELKSLSRLAVIIFTDQLVSSIDAPLLVSSSDRLWFLSGLEIVLNNTYGFTLHIWRKQGFTEITPKENGKSILQSIDQHLDECHHLGNAWLAGHMQKNRLPGTRLNEAKIRLKTFCSSAMHMALKSSQPCHDHIYNSIKIMMDMQKNLNLPKKIKVNAP